MHHHCAIEQRQSLFMRQAERVIDDWERPWDLLLPHLYWSANHDAATWENHLSALGTLHGGEQHLAFERLCAGMDDNLRAQQLLRSCHRQDRRRFWTLARSVVFPEGPRADC